LTNTRKYYTEKNYRLSSADKHKKIFYCKNHRLPAAKVANASNSDNSKLNFKIKGKK
jgi:hypothetical protein